MNSVNDTCAKVWPNCQQDRAMALDQSTNFACISCVFVGKGIVSRHFFVRFWRHAQALYMKFLVSDGQSFMQRNFTLLAKSIESILGPKFRRNSG
jgi:hypothetical protein